MYKQLFVHSMFRAGSTYFFNKLRSSQAFTCFYEPLHQDLIRLRKDNIDTFWGFDPKKDIAKDQNHPSLELPHFEEYKALFNTNNDPLPYFKKSFSFDEYEKVISENFKHYIDLIISSVDNKIPMLQFNRTTLRINWFKKNYKQSYNVYLLRNPRDQFESYLGRSAHVFDVMNLLILKNCQSFSYLMKKLNLPNYTDKNFSKEYGYYTKVLNTLSKNVKYEIFYTIWLESLKHAARYADQIVVMEMISDSIEYKQRIQKMFDDNFNIKIDFDDFSMSSYKNNSLTKEEFEGVEKQLNTSLDDEIVMYINYYKLGGKNE